MMKMEDNLHKMTGICMSHNSVAHTLCGVYFPTSALQSSQSIGAVSNIFCLHQLLSNLWANLTKIV